MRVSRAAQAGAGETWSWWGIIAIWQMAMFLLAPLADAKKNEPIVKVNKFDHYPLNVNYFKGSDVVLFQDRMKAVLYRSEDGGVSWSKVEDIQAGKATTLVLHEFDSQRAYVLTDGITHWRTEDRGKTWKEFMVDAIRSIFSAESLVFHADDPNSIIFNGMSCELGLCDEVAMYTLDGFRSDAKLLRGNTRGCWWAKSTAGFSTGEADLDHSRSLCIVADRFSFFSAENSLHISDNYFSAASENSNGDIQEFEPPLQGDNRPVRGIVNLAVVKKYLLVAAMSRNTDEMALYVSDNTLKWHRAVFPANHRLKQEAYTVLEGTNYSIQVDVMNSRPSNPMGVMLTSNSNGTYFTKNVEHTNRNAFGHVDFEKMSGIQGIFMINQVDNWQSVENDRNAKKKIKTKITFDDGRTFEPVRADGKELQLHSVTELQNTGRVFSSPAPGLVMGNGNHGEFLGKYEQSDLYISDDAGKTWVKGLEGPHKYEFGDQGSILLAIHDGTQAGELKYSLDHGQKWKTVKIPNNLQIRPWVMTTNQESSSLKFILTGQSGSAKKGDEEYYVISVDFEGLHEATCTQGDMEDWYARLDKDGKPGCIMGHTQKYHRRKKDAECFIKHSFEIPAPDPQPCDCSDADFECDFNFIRKDGECVPAGPLEVPEGACASDDPDETFEGTTGWRLIPGNTCKLTKDTKNTKQGTKEWKCADAKRPNGPASGRIEATQKIFKGSYENFDKHYLERGDSSTGMEETVIMRPYKGNGEAGDIIITQDHGKTWTTPKALVGHSIWSIVTHPHIKDMVYFLTSRGIVYYTTDRGLHFDMFEAPHPPHTRPGEPRPMTFHPDKKDWIIWHGKKCKGNACHTEASITRDRGDNWMTVGRYVSKCEFTGSVAYRPYGREDEGIMCLAKTQENNELATLSELKYSDNVFIEPLKSIQSPVKDFATMSEFIMVAGENRTETGNTVLEALASLNGKDFAQAHFPPNFEVDSQRAYTVLDSSSHAVNLFVATGLDEDRTYGTILKSSSNGTSYVLSIANVNCNNQFYVDFEKMLGLQGVVLVNTVQNPDETDSDKPKKLQTRISHNDGAEWSFLPPPEKDVDGDSLSCSSSDGDEQCALHVHGYTERIDHRKTYSSENAIGIMFGWGNVGSELGSSKDADTFMTTDAGISWRMVKRGRWTWSIGDQGSILILAQRFIETKTLSYTIDEGMTWQDYDFAEGEGVIIMDITTLRSGSSRNFLLWGQAGNDLVTINLDFSGLANHECQFDEEDPEKSDYNLWSPEHPKTRDGCLFGHKSQYLRRKTDRKCYNPQKLEHLYQLQNCTCTRQDYECGYNFQLDGHGSCSLVPGLEPISAEQYCKDNPDAYEYYEPSGYRRIPLTTCFGGMEYDKTGPSQPCPGKEKQYEKAHSVSGIAIFFAIIIPVGLAAAAGWWVWRNGAGKFGQIRLGEQASFDIDRPWVKYPVMAVAAAVALVSALPLIASSVGRSVSSFVDRVRGRGDGDGGAYSWVRGNTPRRFTTRDSFSRGRSNYAIVDEDEGELLGEDSDEEV